MACLACQALVTPRISLTAPCVASCTIVEQGGQIASCSISTSAPRFRKQEGLASVRPIEASFVKPNPGLGKSGGGGAGLLERPDFDQSQLAQGPRTEEGGDIGLLRRMMRNGGGDKYRVLLLDHEKHTEKGVASILPTVVPSLTPDEARRVFHESKELGAGLVTVAVKEHAEFYAQEMARKGLRSTVAPESDTV